MARPWSRGADVLPCVVLAGGLGTRMRPMTERIPKALIPVMGRPFAELQLEWLAGQGVEHVVYSIGYRADMIREALGSGEKFGLRLEYVDEGDDLRGSGGALRLALDRKLLPDQFFVLGDNSPASSDARLWTSQHFVQRDLLIGKALFIYWPHPLNLYIPFTNIGIGIVPNVPAMGFIR